jgi:hypothetical protein
MGMMAKESDAQLDVLVEEVTESMLLSHSIAPTVLNSIIRLPSHEIAHVW